MQFTIGNKIRVLFYAYRDTSGHGNLLGLSAITGKYRNDSFRT